MNKIKGTSHPTHSKLKICGLAANSLPNLSVDSIADYEPIQDWVACAYNDAQKAIETGQTFFIKRKIAFNTNSIRSIYAPKVVMYLGWALTKTNSRTTWADELDVTEECLEVAKIAEMIAEISMYRSQVLRG